MDLKRDYFEDLRLITSRSQAIWVGLLLVGVMLLPLFVKSYLLTMVELVAINIIVALGLNLLVGNTGQISLGHNGFVALGAYTLVLLLKIEVPFPLALLAGGGIASLFGALLGLPSLRLEGPYLAIATLGFGLAVMVLIGRADFLGGRMGLSVPRISLKWTGLSYDRALYYLIIGLAIFFTIATHSLVKSRVGRAFQAIRDSDIAAAAIGIHLAKYKTLSFAISAFFAGIAGGLMALYLNFINPTLFSFVMSINFLAMIVLGGLGTITGSVLGAIVLTLLTLQLNSIAELPGIGPGLVAFSEKFMTVAGLPNLTWICTGLVLILIIIFEPLGLFGIWMRIKWYWKTWPF
ncbi:MAG: branched-chain amino acid ABC transporter permease [Lewinellaceae bacterium]|nr:branched-chain amino acid ABC transporter permease [Lewinellaceae bacterium]